MANWREVRGMRGLLPDKVGPRPCSACARISISVAFVLIAALYVLIPSMFADDAARAAETSTTASILVVVPRTFGSTQASDLYPVGDRQTPETMRARTDSMLAVMQAEPSQLALRIERVHSPEYDRINFLEADYDWLVWMRPIYHKEKVVWFKIRKGEHGHHVMFVDDLRRDYDRKKWQQAFRFETASQPSRESVVDR